MAQTVEHLHEGPQRREATRRFPSEVYDDPLVQAQEDYWALRGHVLAEYISLVDEERRESWQERRVIHPHSPHIHEAFPLRGSRSAGVAPVQE
jgi:hypothetical protein